MPSPKIRSISAETALFSVRAPFRMTVDKAPYSLELSSSSRSAGLEPQRRRWQLPPLFHSRKVSIPCAIMVHIRSWYSLS